MKKVFIAVAGSIFFFYACEKEEHQKPEIPVNQSSEKAYKTIYGVTEPATGISQLVTVNPTTGATSGVNITYQSVGLQKARAIAQRKSDALIFVLTGSNSANYPSQMFTVTTAGIAGQSFNLFVNSNGTRFDVGDMEFDPITYDLYLTEYGSSYLYRMTASQLSSAQLAGTYTLTSANIVGTAVTNIVGETIGHKTGLAFDLQGNLFICNSLSSLKAQVNKLNGALIGSVCNNGITGTSWMSGVGMCFTGGRFITRHTTATSPPLTIYIKTIQLTSSCTPGAPGTSGSKDVTDLTAIPDVCPGCE